ncbi:DUF3488 and DUF4129 domain-containing transglutaminase family protein [Schlegelella sp. S2-27]|uniref:DUF3488 and DUF4129 domain-containing transglutaminase family protein n=1 Tax=Caldimonas mangrovi TaxID=2944811 RepID=A0ABT0YHW4_9BURK|nr:DUF3488 and DUF4129 domain-containing transglutaminase family protein [Caldimonas mangrovi]MCM5678326.1 DUF3488 and DUF4129 domain-containing transglutaminase family protein [Caldimonas mangrovi]
MTSPRSTAASWLTPPHWPGWRHLPRETRDTLFLLGVITWVVAPHVSHLPWWCSALAGCVLLWRAWLALAGTALPGRWVLAALLLASLGATFLTHRTLLGKEAGVTLVVVLMALKTLELRARRDALAVFFLGFFLVLTHFLYSQTLLLALAMVLAVWGLLTGLVVAHMPVGQPSLARAGGLAARMCLFGAPVMVALFVLFPRFGPLWGLPSDAFSGRTGLSERMEMGHMARLALDENTAMTVKFDGRAPPPSALYFRGPVLADFDGRRWRPLPYRYWPRGQDVDADLRVSGPALHYEMTVEPTQVAVIPALEMTPQIDDVEGVQLRLRDDMQWHSYAPLRERQRFRGVAYTGFRHGPSQPVQGLRPYVALPAGYNPRTLAWAAELKQQPRYAQADAGTLARAVLEHIRRENFVYTLEPGSYGDENGYHAIDEFWLGRREGFCEHFAAAFVVVMRAMGVPARIVTGYQGAELNPVDGYYLVRNSFAHAWAEFWQPGVGWVRADPTAAVAPSRIGSTVSLRPPPGFVASAFDNVNPELWRRMRNQWDALNNAWNQWVLNYTRGRQLDLLKQLGFRSPSWQDLSLLLIGLIIVAATAGAAWAWWERRRQDPWVRAYHRMQAHLAAAGLPSGPHTPPRTLAALALQHWGPAAEKVSELLARMEALRYAPASARGRPGAPTLARSLARDLRRAVLDLRHA